MRVFLAAAAIVILLRIITPALGHSWYPPECCSGEDCRPLADHEVADYVRPMPDGRWYIVKWNTVVDMKDWSPDNKFHICESAYKFYCLYVPQVPGL